MEIFYENLPLDVKLNLGEYLKTDEDLAAFTKRVAISLGILARYQPKLCQRFPSSFDFTRDHFESDSAS